MVSPHGLTTTSQKNSWSPKCKKSAYGQKCTKTMVSPGFIRLYTAKDNRNISVTLIPCCCASGQQMVKGMCFNCSVGEYSEQGWNVCTAYTPGKFSSSVGSSSCVHCVVGKYSATFGDVACTDCPISSLCSVIQQKPGITLRHTRKSTDWITLLFSVPCITFTSLYSISRGL